MTNVYFCWVLRKSQLLNILVLYPSIFRKSTQKSKWSPLSLGYCPFTVLTVMSPTKPKHWHPAPSKWNEFSNHDVWLSIQVPAQPLASALMLGALNEHKTAWTVALPPFARNCQRQKLISLYLSLLTGLRWQSKRWNTLEKCEPPSETVLMKQLCRCRSHRLPLWHNIILFTGTLFYCPSCFLLCWLFSEAAASWQCVVTAVGSAEGAQHRVHR